jgi:uncharacterized protein YecA (UPF0149 family)
MDIQSVLPLLQQMGVDPSKLGPEKLAKLMQITDKIKDPNQITQETVREITDIFGLETNGVPQPKKRKALKIGRNEPCPCESGKKWKKCCM